MPHCEYSLANIVVVGRPVINKFVEILDVTQCAAGWADK